MFQLKPPSKCLCNHFPSFISTILLAGILSLCTPLFAGDQIDLSKLEPQNRFDFLVGKWTYTFAAGHGETSYRKGPGGAILEILAPGFIQGTEFNGSSILLYSAEKKRWSHHWIDTLGNVLQGSGKMEDYAESDLPALVVFFESGGTHFKHVWYNIEADRFDTDLFVSSDGGQAYNLARRMPFIRKKG